MPRFLIEVDHPADRAACLRAIRQVLEMGSHWVTHAEWGCFDGVHSGWLVVEVGSREEARQVLPPADRAGARIVQLARFDLAQLDEMERTHPA